MLNKLVVIKLAFVLFLPIAIGACPSAHVHVFSARPQLPMRVLGMLNGSGPNEATAMEDLVRQAQNMEANGLVIIEQKALGRLVVIRAEAIRFRGRLPEQR